MKKLFISHSSKNKVIANQLISYLERLGLEHKNMFCSSSISQGAKNGEDLNSRIGQAIKNSYLIIYLISRDFLKSSYCIEELGVGWYLSQESNKKCFYVLLPDVELSDLFGFVNDKIQKFSFINISQKKSFISLTEDISNVMKIKGKNLTTQIEYINIFFNAINAELNTLIQNKSKEENEISEYNNRLSNLQQLLKDKEKAIQEYKQKLNQNNGNLDRKLLLKELDTIQSNFFILGSPDGITEKQYKSLSKQFWFKMINRYEELTEALKIISKDCDMEMLVASVYTIENKYDKAYGHYIEYVKNCDSGIYYHYFELFLNKFKKSVKELIEIMQQKITNTEEGIVKDALIETVNLLLKREMDLGFDN